MSTKPHEGLPPDAPSDVRPLPARPNLEFERKQAKKLLAALHDGDPEALARVRAKHRASAGKVPDEFHLSDAQFAIAREYGFTSWPTLVEYFEASERQYRSGVRQGGMRSEDHSRAAERLLATHRTHRPSALLFATFVPRLYGRNLDQTTTSQVTLDDARLVHARMHRYPSWQMLLESARKEGEPRENEWTRSGTSDYRAGRAIRGGDIAALGRLMDQNPHLMEKVPRPGHAVPINILHSALLHEVEVRTAAARAITDYIVSRGGDLRETASAMLVRPFPQHGPGAASAIEYLLERGADPEWLPPNGVPVIEHAICNYWNGTAVDAIARRTKPRQALWIAAGLGDVDAVSRYVLADGSLAPAARQNRPDFTALMVGPTPFLPDADDTAIIWEAFFVAGLNQRYGVLELLLDRGFPIDYMEWGQSLLHLAVGNRWVDLVEFLVRRGANVDLPGSHPNTSARQAAEYIYGHSRGPDEAESRRLLQLCGGRDADVVSREAAEERATQTRPSRVFLDALTSARQDAIHTGRTSAGLENLFVGLLRGSNQLAVTYLNVAGVDLERLKALLGTRLDPSEEPVDDVPFDDWASQAAMDAQEEAKRRRRTQINPLHLLFVLVKTDESPVADIIRVAGGNVAKVRAILERDDI